LSDVRSDIEGAVLEALRETRGLEGVKTWETSVRECLFARDTFTKGFRAEELPAVTVAGQLKPTLRNAFSAGEEQQTIPVTVMIVTRAQRARDAMAAAAELQDVVDGVVRGFRKSGNSLGPNVVVMGECSSSATYEVEAPLAFGISSCEFTVLRVIEV
jgi:hypothetical protein